MSERTTTPAKAMLSLCQWSTGSVLPGLDRLTWGELLRQKWGRRGWPTTLSNMARRSGQFCMARMKGDE
jgi:hypothetical protein